MCASTTSLGFVSFESIVSENIRHPRKCRFYMEFAYCKFGNYCRFRHDNFGNKNALKEIEELKSKLEK